ncbi:MAG: Xaa-Pro peptidase family protein [Candidatus Jordarchaeaceae archaeon]
MSPNINRLKSLMEKYEFSLIVASTPANVTYMTGFSCLSHKILRDTKIFALLSKHQDKPVIIAPIAELDTTIDTEVYVNEIIPYGKFYFTSINRVPERVKAFLELANKSRADVDVNEILTEEIIKRINPSNTVGIDDPYLLSFLLKRIKNCSNVKMKDASNLFQMARMKKTGEEVSIMKRSAEMVEGAIEYCLEFAREGETEIDMTKKFNKFVIDQGGSPVFTIIGFGERSAYPNVEPSERKLKKGDIIRFDVGCIWKNYCSDISRTVVFGEPEKKHKEYYEAIHAGLKKGIEEIRAGIKVSEIFEVITEFVKKTIPHYRRHHCGHGIGLEIFEPPAINPRDTTVLEEGMTLCVETPYYELGWGGLQVEDEVVVSNKGCEYITHKDSLLRWWR